MKNNSRFFYIKTHLNLHWGFSTRKILFSKTRDSYLIPPPTTLIGVLAYGLARIRKYPEEGDGGLSTADYLRKYVKSVNVRVNTALHHYSDLSRIWWYRKREKKTKFDAVALGKVYTHCNDPALTVTYILVGEAENELKDLLLASYSISRVGVKEGITSVSKVEYGVAEVVSSNEAEISYSFWHDLAEIIEGDYMTQSVIDFMRTPIGDYSRAAYRVQAYPYNPITKEPTRVRVRVRAQKALILKTGNEVVITDA